MADWGRVKGFGPRQLPHGRRIHVSVFSMCAVIVPFVSVLKKASICVLRLTSMGRLVICSSTLNLQAFSAIQCTAFVLITRLITRMIYQLSLFSALTFNCPPSVSQIHKHKSDSKILALRLPQLSPFGLDTVGNTFIPFPLINYRFKVWRT
jgi:hypothetical protein